LLLQCNPQSKFHGSREETACRAYPIARGAEGASPVLASPDETLRQQGPCYRYLWKVPGGIDIPYGTPMGQSCGRGRIYLSTPGESLRSVTESAHAICVRSFFVSPNKVPFQLKRKRGWAGGRVTHPPPTSSLIEKIQINHMEMDDEYTCQFKIYQNRRMVRPGHP